MRVLVTGTSGRVGSVTAREFLDNGYAVRALDKMPPPDDIRARAQVVYADITDRLALLHAAEGCDCIAHLAAIPSPGRQVDDQILHTNVVGTGHVFAAAEAHGIRHVALASTCCTFGIFFAHHPIDPQYLPMDENHPVLPQDLYALSKVLNEEIAAAYTRRAGMVTVCLRLTTVMDLGGEHVEWQRRRITRADEWRAGDLWTYVDTRDAARAFRLAVESPQEGSHVVIIAARDAFTTHDIRDLVRKHYPSVAHFADRLERDSGLYDTRRAEQVIGFVASHRWRDVPELAEAAG
jgi:nucleoside-diphosphate-sugar epimerase